MSLKGDCLGGGKERILGVKKIELCYIYKDSIMKPTKCYLRRGGEIREYNRGSELVQSTLYASMELPQ
jgi:hypothetical protein